MPRIQASVMTDWISLVRVIEVRRGRRIVQEHAVEVDTEAGWCRRWHMLPNGNLPPGPATKEMVHGRFELEFKEPTDERSDAEAEWFPWTAGDRPPFKSDMPALTEEV